jgi:hypothetical protein
VGVGLPVELAGSGRRRRKRAVDARAGRGDASHHHGSDYVNQIGWETDEGTERIKAAYGRITSGLRP